MTKDAFQRAEPLDQRVKIQFTSSQNVAVSKRADSVGMPVAAYLRMLALNDIEPDAGHAPSARQIKQRSLMLQVAELHALAVQVKKLGVNVNQIAKQANSGMVPITRAEVIYMLNQHQVLMSNAMATVEKLLK